MSDTPAPDLSDPRCFAVDLDVANARVALLPVSEAALASSVFHDNRLQAPLAEARWHALQDLVLPPVRATALLLHTSFCSSTLLANALHLPPRAVALKEPLVLRRLADACFRGQPFQPMVAPAMRLLARPWREDGRVLLKPTHAALNVAADLLEAAPGTRALLLYGSLDDFLVSNFKKPPETQQRVPELAERALRATDLAARLPRPALEPAHLGQMVALQWAAQFALAQQLVAAGGARLRVLRETDLLRDLPAATQQAARWLGLPHDAAELADHAQRVSGEHAKAPGHAYGTARRAEEADYIRRRFGIEIDDARRWFERHILPTLATESL